MEEEKQQLEYVISEFSKLIEENELKQESTQKAYSNDVDTMIEILNKLQYKKQALEKNILKPYFARIDFKDKTTDKVEKCYIGKIGTINEDNKIVTVDWRAPISSLYYDNSVGECSYLAPGGKIDGELLLKRQYEIENKKLISYSDIDIVSNDDLLNSCLNSSMEARLKNIVSTIQKEQNDIIRKTIDEDIIVQGVAGSGKTTVALHRIAYLVYKNQNYIDSNQYMIIGPNKFFVNYISSVLPDLDVNGVPEYDLLEFTNTYLGEAIKLVKENDTELTKYKMSMDYKEIIDEYFEELNSQVIPDMDLEMFGFSIISKKEIEKIYKEVTSETEFILDRVERTIMFIKNKIALERENILVNANDYMANLFNKETDPSKLKSISLNRDKLSKEIKSDCVQLLKKYFNIINEKTTTLYLKLLSKLNYGNKLKYEDLVGLLYLRYRIVGNYDYIKYRHVVVDEAQDYGNFFFYTIKKIMKNATFSVFGDLAQTIYQYRTVESWNNVISVGYKNNILYLTKSYRTTIEIMEKANLINKYLGLTIADAVIRHGPDVSIRKSVSEDDLLVQVNELINKGYKTIAIISKDSSDSVKVYNNLKDKVSINLIDENSQEYDGGIVSLTSSLSKGLEFDAVIINNTENSAFDINNSFDMKLLYVSMTRALHELIIDYKNDLVSVIDE